MFVPLLTYIKPLTEVDALMRDQLGGPPALREHDAAERGRRGAHRRRCDVRIAARWPTAVITPTPLRDSTTA